jgi:hypothetical protein
MVTAKVRGEAVGLCTIVWVKAGAGRHFGVSKCEEKNLAGRIILFGQVQETAGTACYFGPGWRKHGRGFFTHFFMAFCKSQAIARRSLAHILASILQTHQNYVSTTKDLAMLTNIYFEAKSINPSSA